MVDVSIPLLKERLLSRVTLAIKDAEFQSYKLILIIMPLNLRQSLQTELQVDSIEFVNLSKLLSKQLVSQSIKSRVKNLQDEVNVISQQCDEFVWLTNLDVLFEPSLDSDPMMLLKKASNSQTIIVIWPGSIVGSSLVYSRPGKLEYKSYLLNELNDIQVIDTCHGEMK